MFQNVKYELQEIERLIAEGETKGDIKKSTLTALNQQLLLEVERIKKTLIHEVFTFEDERHLERYIQFHQTALIGLLDKLDSYRHNNNNRQELFNTITTHLDTILRFIERHFAKYFDQDAKAPEAYLDLARHEYIAHIDSFTKYVTALHADQTLWSLLLQVLQNIIDSTIEKGMTFRQVMYAMEVKKELVRIIEKETPTDINADLRQAMYYLNYNSVKVVTYHAHYITALLESAETRSDKIERLSLVFKTISQAQVKPEIRYIPNAPSLKEQLTEYISVEMEYQERLQRLSDSTPPKSDNPLSNFKLKFEASLAQLAYLIRIFQETKLISNTNVTHLLQFIATFSMTKRSEGISFPSIRAKFYNVEHSTRQAVRGMLLAMIQHIDRS